MARFRKHSTKKALILGIFYIILVIVLVGGLSYAFFTASVDGNEEASSTIIETADLRLVFSDTIEINMMNALPGESISKTFTVENKGTIEIEYTIDLKDLTNTFKNGELVYSLSSDNGGAVVNREPLPTSEEISLTTSTIAPGVIQTYTIEVLFLETGSDQNANQGAVFNGTLQINSIGEYSYNSGQPEEPEIPEMEADDRILYDNPEMLDDSLIDFSLPASDTNGKGLYYTADATVSTYGEDGERIYYYRGDVENNWLSFGGYLWRIVRTTSEGGIKLVYSGDGLTDSSAFITEAPFNQTVFNKYYIGYTFNTSLNSYTGTQTNSNIKTVVDGWYSGSKVTGVCYNVSNNSNESCEYDFTTISSKLSDSEYSSYLSETAVYCADRSREIPSDSYTNFPAFERLVTNKRPSYACEEANASRYTVDSSTGNGYLTYPIGILSADEVSYSGIVFKNSGTFQDAYIMDNTSDEWWVSSPHIYSEGAMVWRVQDTGALYPTTVNSTLGIRPSISFKSCVTITDGDGSIDDPYKVSNSGC